MAKEGSTIGGLMDSLGTAISVALQYGVPVESLVTKFAHQRFEPMGITTNSDIPFAKSLVDYIFRWFGMQFIQGYRDANAPKRISASGHSNDGFSPMDIGHMDPSMTTPAPAATVIPTPKPTLAPTQETTTWSNNRFTTTQDSQTKLSQSGTHIIGRTSDGEKIADISSSSRITTFLHADDARSNDESAMTPMTPIIVEHGEMRPLGHPAQSLGHPAQSLGSPALTAADQANAQLMGDAPACDSCGSITVRNGTCYRCWNCGSSMGCS
jgi:ribonucleoside-diphosphate reductase alpha chain